MNLWTILLGIAGLAIVALMVLFGVDLVRASRTGPRWKRALVTAAVSLMSVLGITTSPGRAADPVVARKTSRAANASPVVAVFDLDARLKKLAELTSARDFDAASARRALRDVQSNVAILSDPANVAKLTAKGRAEANRLLAAAAKQTAVAQALIPIGTTDLARSEQWKTVTDAWRYAVPLADSHKSTTVQRKIAKQKLKDAGEAMKTLLAAGLLTGAEAALLRIDATRINSDILRDPPTDSRVQCYDYGYMPAVKLSMSNLAGRVALFKKVIAADRIAPAAMDRIVERVERELAQLIDPKLARNLRTDADRRKAKRLHADVSALVVQVKRKVLVERLGKTSGWQVVEGTFTAAAPLAKSHRSTSAQRVDIVKRMIASNVTLGSLASVGGLLTAGEAQLLTDELARLRKEIYRDPPTDLRVKCYETMAPDPVGDSTRRLTKRVALLGKLVETGRLNPLVVKRVLPSVRADIKTLTNAKKAATLRQKAGELLAQIDGKLVGAGGR